MAEDHDELKRSIAAYVLGAVPDDELPRLRAHILRCEECFGEAEGYSGVVATLHADADPVALPEGFAARVAEAAVSRPTPAPKPRRIPGYQSWLAAGAAALALIFGIGLIDARNDLAQRDKIFNALVREDGFPMTGPSGAVARVVPSNEGAVLVVAGLADSPDEHTYQLWLLAQGEDPASAGTFEVRDGVAIFESDHEMQGFDGAAVTLEPDGGSSAPTSEPVLTSA